MSTGVKSLWRIGNGFMAVALAAVIVSVLPTTCAASSPQDPAGSTQQDAAKDKAEAKTEKAKPAKPPIYDEDANAQDQIDAAIAKSKKENRRVLIQWGGNWCGWCHLLHELMSTNAEIRRKLLYEYDVVLVDIGKMDKNQDLVAKYKADIKGEGVPYLTVLDGNGEVVVNQETSSLENKDKDNPGHKPEAVLEFLTKYQSEPLEAATVLDDAIASAKADNKLVFLHFGAPWCGWCHHLENWMAQPEIKSMLEKAFVDVKIDTDRMTGGSELLSKYCKEPSGIPWFVFMNPKTKEVIVTSDGPKGNVGFPSTDEEIAYFATMLTKCDDAFTADQIETLTKSLVTNREEREAAAKQQKEAAKKSE